MAKTKKICALDKASAYALDEKAKALLPEILLIENAACQASQIAQRIFRFKKCAVFAGRGNNGADALAFCRQILNAQKKAEVFLVLGRKKPNRQVEFELEILKKAFGLQPYVLKDPWAPAALKRKLGRFDLLVDGIFGIGFRRPLAPFYQELFSLINRTRAKTLSLDIPSGLEAEGKEVETAVQADATVTFLAPKQSAFVPQLKRYWGKVFVADIGLSYAALKSL